MRNLRLTSPRVVDGDHRRAGSRGEGTQTHPHAEIVRMPSGSIVSIPSLEPLHLAEARLKEALLFALPLSIILWILIGLAVWALFF